MVLLKEILFGRFTVWVGSMFLSVLFLGLTLSSSAWFLAPSIMFVAFTGLGLRDFAKKTHPVRANYPLMGRIRYVLESVRPELRQYFWESDTDETPYSRNQRAMVYQRSKDNQAKRSFGTERNVYEEDYNWLNHSMLPIKINYQYIFTIFKLW